MTTTQEDEAEDDAMWLDDAHVDPVWIAQELGLSGCTSCSAVDISNQMRVGARVRDGATLRLTLTYDNNTDKDHPQTLIVKQIATSPSRALAQQLGLAREALFYKHLAPQIAGDSVLPQIYYSVGDMAQGRKRVVMEDLGTGVDSGILFGPGNPNNWNRDNMAKEAARVGNPSSQHVTRTTFEAMARIHALYWKNAALLDDVNDWLRGHSWIQERGRDTWEASQQLLRDFWKAYLQMEQDKSDKLIDWDPVVRASVEKAVAGISWDAQLQRLNANNPQCQWTLVHGDFWPGNVLWMEGSQLKLVDWEMVGLGSGPQELGQYVLSNMTRADRRACEDDLVRAYYKVLQQHGVTTLSWDECWKEYTVGGVERWLWFLTYFCGKGMKDWAQFFHNQIAEFMADHHLTEKDIVQPRP